MIKAIQENKDLYSYGLAVLIIAFATYFVNYYNPAAVFWDENYHIASAQKYIAGVMYMEPHPPLGKLFIALGEWIVHPNDALDLTPFTQTDYVKNFPKDYSWAGVRLFPALFGTFSALIFFLILYQISKRAELSFLFSSLYLFENAFILQSRSAMLESTQIFFIFLSVLYFLIILDKEKVGYRHYFGFGVMMGLSLMIKANGLILILLFPFLFLYRVHWDHGYLLALKRFVLDGLVILAGMAVVVVVVFSIHFSLGDKVGVKKYKASPEYLTMIKEGKNSNLLNFPVMLKDNFAYMRNYSKGVPKFDICKKGENGSFVTTWPFGNKTINYRWSKKDGKVSYLYLQGNPIVWFSVVFAMILAITLLLGRFIFGLEVKDRRLFFLTGVFTSIYLSYMITIYNIDRVMYLYHYFIPLFMGTFVLFILFNYLFKESIDKGSKLLYFAVTLMAIEILYVYYFFGPLTYYKPLSTIEFLQRDWFDFWKLKPIL
ncbi:MAG: phospholipid carrier-dependent glycosyltransferase [Epsilonproteobacteria bacterium]|nr:MAG: phospholipid carrier-dependent glycosyltransferase [Campylobacterota bacterium]